MTHVTAARVTVSPNNPSTTGTTREIHGNMLKFTFASGRRLGKTCGFRRRQLFGRAVLPKVLNGRH